MSALDTCLRMVQAYDEDDALMVAEAAAELAALRERVRRLEEALSRAHKIDWESVADRIEYPGDYVGDDHTAKQLRRFAAALEQS